MTPEEYQAEVAAAGARVALDAMERWRTVPRGDIATGWERRIPQVVENVTAAQTAVVQLADPYLVATVGGPVTAVIDPPSLAGAAADGRSLTTMLEQPRIRALTGIQQGLLPGTAMDQAMDQLAMLIRTTIADSARQAVAVAMTTHPHCGGYYRQLTLPSCARCAILAGRHYATNAGFLRHPKCFPGNVVVSGPRLEAATRRWYEGKLVVLTTESGQELALTGNHPILTRRGWLPAHLLNEFDEVVRSTSVNGAAALVVPDHHQVPSRIEDVWGSFGVAGFHTVESSPQDFHGDGQHGEVDVVRPDGPLDYRMLAALLEQTAQQHFAFTPRPPVPLHGQGMPELLYLRDAPHARSSVGLSRLTPALLGRHEVISCLSCLAHASAINTGTRDDPCDWAPGDPILPGQAMLAGAGQIGGDDVRAGELSLTPRWDAPGLPLSVETRDGYAARGRDLLQRLSPQVELDRVVEVRLTHWSGHVYSLTSSEGWHCANSLIVSNCDCVHIPVGDAGDGPQYSARRAILDGQVTGLSKDATEAIRLGASPSSVVNARRGMSTLADGTRVTTEGTTRRGLASTRMRSAGQTVRPMPEQIIRDATSREDAIRRLYQYGYIV